MLNAVQMWWRMLHRILLSRNSSQTSSKILKWPSLIFMSALKTAPLTQRSRSLLESLCVNFPSGSVWLLLFIGHFHIFFNRHFTSLCEHDTSHISVCAPCCGVIVAAHLCLLLLDTSYPLGTQQQTCCMPLLLTNNGTDRWTDWRTLDCFTDPALHTVRAVWHCLYAKFDGTCSRNRTLVTGVIIFFSFGQTW